jgi:CheY-like chemotaxis protein
VQETSERHSGGSEGGAGPQETRTLEADEDLPGLNGARLDALRAAVGVDTLGRLLSAFGAANEGRIARLRAENASVADAGDVAHELQGSAASVGADRLAALAGKLSAAAAARDAVAVSSLARATIDELELLATLLPGMTRPGGADGATDPRDSSDREDLTSGRLPEASRYAGHGCDDVMEGVRVLLVDDAEDVRLLGAELLAASGCSVDVAVSGREALDRVLDGEWPDVIVLDIQMPGLDGWATLEALRSDAATAHLAVILCTVDESSQDHLRACQLGADGYLAKPYSADDLVYVVTEVAHRSDAERLRIRSSRVRMTSRRMGQSQEAGEESHR